jgi:hypothetical protein
MVSVIVGAGAGFYGIYVNGQASKPKKEVCEKCGK